MRTTRLIAVLVGLAAIAMVTADASAYYHPGMGRFMSRDPGAGSAMRIGAGGSAVGGGFAPRDPIPYGPMRLGISGMVSIAQFVPDDQHQLNHELEPPISMSSIVSVIERMPNPIPSNQMAGSDELVPNIVQYADGMNLYAYVCSSSPNYVDPTGLSTKCGSLTMKCKSGNKQWPVYGNSRRAKFILGGRDGCVTLLIPKAIFCTGSCSEIKDWRSGGDTSVKILEHEACHACAHEDPCDSYFLSWIPGDLTGHCDRNKKNVTPGW